MGRWFELVARLAIAGLLAAGLLVVPGSSPAVAVARSSGCPSATIQRIVGEGAARCYGTRTLTFGAYVQGPCDDGCGGTKAAYIRPGWLDDLDGSFVGLAAGPRSYPGIAAYVPPALGRCSGYYDLKSCPFHPYRGRWATVTARFNLPVLRTCRYFQPPGGPGFTKKDAIAECSMKLIVLSIGPAAPETDVAAAGLERPASAPAGLPLVGIFIVALLLAVRWFPSRRRATGPVAAGRAWGRIAALGRSMRARA